jgi:CubicO group peptidase (beta-lactamase class C family)
MTATVTDIGGTVAEGFERVAEAFAESFSGRGDIGAACAVRVGGEQVVDALAAQAPLWEPGTAHGYHALTYGHLVGEVSRRVSGRSVGDFVREHIAGPAFAEFHIGVPDGDLDRVAPLLDFLPGDIGDDPDPLFVALLRARSPTGPSWWRRCSSPPSTSGSSSRPRSRPPTVAPSARSLARIYGGLVSEVDGVRLLDPAQVDDARAEQAAGDDLVMVGAANRLASGYRLPDPLGAPAGGRLVRTCRAGRVARLRPARARDQLRVRDEPVPGPREGRPPHRRPARRGLACTA